MNGRLATSAATLAMAGLLLAGCSVASSGDGAPDPVRDRKGHALNQERLSVAVEDLNSVVDPPHARANGPAAAHGCSLDSGEAFEPEASRRWTLTGPARVDTDPTSVDADPLRPNRLGRQAMELIAAQLIARGWSGTGRVEQVDDGVYFISLRRTSADHKVVLGIQGFSDAIDAIATTTPENLCGRRP